MNKNVAFKSTTVDSLTLVKALAICLVVANHTYMDAVSLHGGLNVLMVVSGVAMASFAFHGTTAQTLCIFKSFTLRLVVPSVILALAWNIAAYFMSSQVTAIKWTEHLLISNWLSMGRVALFPIWYVQVIFQLMIALAVVFWVFDLTPYLKKAPVRATMIAFVISLLLAVTSYELWDTAYLQDKLPHLLAWNFVFGWVYWAFAVRHQKSPKTRLILSAILLAAEILIFKLCGALYGDARFISLTVLGLLLIWVDSISLPNLLARPVLLISQATFYIFLFHYYAFWATWRAGKLVGLGDLMNLPLVRLSVGTVLPVLLWIFVIALHRARKKMSQLEQIKRSAPAVV